MKLIQFFTAAGLSAAALAALASPSAAQGLQLNVCGIPPLPPCERPQPQERVIIEREDDFGTLCRTRNLRCDIDRPRPIGSRCVCEDDAGEEVVGRIVR